MGKGTSGKEKGKERAPRDTIQTSVTKYLKTMLLMHLILTFSLNQMNMMVSIM